MEQRILAELADLESLAQLRHLETVHGIDLGSNDYLGLSTDPRMKQTIRDALDSSSRVASTGSRLLSGHDEVWTAVENDFARWVGAEAALYFTSGYAANIGLLSAVLRPEDAVFSDSANHASLIDGIRLAKCKRVIFPHLDLNALEAELRWTLSGSGARFIVVESIFSMDGDRAALGELAALAARYDAELIVDEAHATGVCGPGGRGCVAEAGLTGRVFASVHTCGKALAAAGALIGFIPYNYPQATAFLGDAGSHLVGYLLAVIAILPHFYSRRNQDVLAVFKPLLILAVPLLDLVWVVLLRWKSGKPFYLGDTNHLSHRLVRRGWSPTRAVLLIWLLAAAIGSLAVL